LIKQASKFVERVKYEQLIRFPDFLKTILQNHYLRFDRDKMNMETLELFVKYGLTENELLNPLQEALNAAKERNELRGDQEKSAIIKDIEIIKQLLSIKLRASYSLFEGYIDNSFSPINMSDAGKYIIK